MADANGVAENASPLAKGLNNVKEAWDNLRIGDGHFTAWVRQGFKEVTHLLLPAFPQGQQVVEEPGLWGNPTQGDVANAREDNPQVKERVSTLNEEPMQQTQTSVRSPADLVEGRLTGPAQGQQQQNRQDMSPADLVETKLNASVQGPQQDNKQEVSPADLAQSTGSPQQEQQQQTQRQGHSVSM